MTDRERAERYHAADEWPDYWAAQRAQDVARLADVFGEVRLDERAAVVAWLRAERPNRRVEVWGLIEGLADEIEQGDHVR